MKQQDRIKDVRLTILDYVIWGLVCLLMSYIVSIIITMIILGVSLGNIAYVINHRYVFIGTIICFSVSIAPFLFAIYVHLERYFIVHRLMGMRKAIEGNLENSKFMTLQEMKKSGYLIFNSIDELRQANDGIILTLQEYGDGNMRTIMSPEVIHTLVLGTTGSGKTMGYIIPCIKALSNTKSKPSFIFTDPKGELNERTAWYLEEQGYKIQVMDFRHPEKSLRWNPLAYAYEKYERAWKITDTTVFKDGKYYFNDKEYNADTIEEAERSEEQRLEDEAYEEIQNIVFALCPINSRDPIWDNGARAFIQAVIIAMLEDSREDELGMTIDKFCFYNVAKICNKTDEENKGLKAYFANRKPTSLAAQYSGMVLNAPDKQQASYLSSVAEKLLMFNDRGICNMTSGKGEINVKEMDEQPTAIYLILPDEKEGRHPFGSLFIAQAYKKLVEKAVENGGRLKRNVYFMMDEFGNMPKIDGVSSMFTVGRSRGIIQMPVIQSYSQIIEKYGTEVAKTVFGNCNTEIFIGAKDDETCEKFSKKLGNYTVLATSITGQSRAYNPNVNESLRERPLMYPRELTLLNNKKNMGNAVIVNQGYSPTLGKFTPCFESKIFNDKTVIDDTILPRALNEDEVFYNHENRAKIIAQMIKEIEELSVQETAEENVAEKKKSRKKNELQSVSEKLSALGQVVGAEITGNYEDDLKVIEQIEIYYREQKLITKLSEVLKLKSKYISLCHKDEAVIEKQ